MSWTVRSAVIVCLSLAAGTSAVAQRPARIRGTVADSARGGVLAGAQVSAVSLDGGAGPTRRAVTDARGRYAIDSVGAGRYRLTVRHAWLDSIGLAVATDTVDVVAGRDRTIDLAVPSAATIFRASCHAARTPDIGMAIGYVRSALTGVPLVGARVSFWWSDFSIDSGTLKVRTFTRGGFVLTDSAGAYRACGLPVGQRLTAQAQLDSVRASGVVDAVVDSTGLTIEPFRVMATAPSGPSGPYAVRGVVRSKSGAPVPYPQVMLLGGEQATTGDEQGRFQLHGLFPGTMRLQLRAIGFAPERIRVDVDSATPEIAVRLTVLAVVLDSVRIYARRAGLPDRLQEFEDRARHPVGGVIFTPEDIERLAPWDVMDLVSRVPSYKVVGSGVDAHIDYRFPPPAGLMPGIVMNGVPCPTLYVNAIPQTSQWGINLISISQVYGVEVYRPHDMGPPGYPNLCGEIFIWTK